VTLPEPLGAFYAFPTVEGLADSSALTSDLLKKTGLALAPGTAFGAAGEGHVRLCFAATEATLTDALARMRSFWDQREAG
jgi:aspartate/methionine/tyrosine aminotransferase